MDELEWVRECDEEEWDELDEWAREWTSAGSADEEVEVEVRELLLLACWLGCEGNRGQLLAPTILLLPTAPSRPSSRRKLTLSAMLYAAHPPCSGVSSPAQPKSSSS